MKSFYLLLLASLCVFVFSTEKSYGDDYIYDYEKIMNLPYPHTIAMVKKDNYLYLICDVYSRKNWEGPRLVKIDLNRKMLIKEKVISKPNNGTYCDMSIIHDEIWGVNYNTPEIFVFDLNTFSEKRVVKIIDTTYTKYSKEFFKKRLKIPIGKDIKIADINFRGIDVNKEGVFILSYQWDSAFDYNPRILKLDMDMKIIDSYEVPITEYLRWFNPNIRGYGKNEKEFGTWDTPDIKELSCKGQEFIIPLTFGTKRRFATIQYLNINSGKSREEPEDKIKDKYLRIDSMQLADDGSFFITFNGSRALYRRWIKK